MNNSIPETSRIEIKFVSASIYYHTVLNWLHVHPAGFVSLYPARMVNNIYFDTYDWFAFAENLSGVSSRTKVRYRWYGKSVYPDAGILEIKQKRNCHGWKHQFIVGEPPYRPGANWHTIKQLLLKHLPAQGKKWVNDNPMPVIINRYFREYFCSSDRKIRVTIDTQMGIWEQRLRPYPNFTHRANIPNIVVIEFKFDRRDYKIVSEIVKGIPIRQSRHSKYVTGVRAITGI